MSVEKQILYVPKGREKPAMWAEGDRLFFDEKWFSKARERIVTDNPPRSKGAIDDGVDIYHISDFS